MKEPSSNNSTAYVLTGNDLFSGDVVYLNRNGRLVRFLHKARLWPDATTAEHAQKLMSSELPVIDLHLIKVSKNKGRLHADSLREHIRANGPSVNASSRIYQLHKGK
jgi:uncharacterized membrane protein